MVFRSVRGRNRESLFKEFERLNYLGFCRVKFEVFVSRLDKFDLGYVGFYNLFYIFVFFDFGIYSKMLNIEGKFMS